MPDAKEFLEGPVASTEEGVKAIEIKLLEQEHRLFAAIRNFFHRKKWEKDDPRRRATLVALFWVWFAPTTIAIGGGGLTLGVLIWQGFEFKKQNDLFRDQNEYFRSQLEKMDSQQTAMHDENRRAERTRLIGVLWDTKQIGVLRKEVVPVANARTRTESLKRFLEIERELGVKTVLAGAQLSDLALIADAFDLRGVILFGADLHGASLFDADLRGADLRGANLRGAQLAHADLRRADLRGADLRGASLICADLRGANLRGANLRGAFFFFADLSDAELISADLRSANLGMAGLRRTNLRRADLIDVELYGADLSGANLSRARVSIERPFWLPEEWKTIATDKPEGWRIQNLYGFSDQRVSP